MQLLNTNEGMTETQSLPEELQIHLLPDDYCPKTLHFNCANQ